MYMLMIILSMLMVLVVMMVERMFLKGSSGEKVRMAKKE